MTTICRNCKNFHKTNCYYICTADKKIVTDFVTGRPKIVGCVKCRDKNTNGNCKDYKDVKDYIDDLINLYNPPNGGEK